jgi:hypothetical protein
VTLEGIPVACLNSDQPVWPCPHQPSCLIVRLVKI